jgi:hypothetical protein
VKQLLVLTLLWSGAAAAADCAPFGSLNFVCGPSAVEDLVQIEETRWLIGSGLAEQNMGGHLHLIDTKIKAWNIAYPSAAVASGADLRRFPNCAEAPDPAKFSAHGLALRRTGRSFELLVVNHGREAIEFFDVQMRKSSPVLKWVGCVSAPADTFINSVAPLPDGGFIATQFYTPSKGGMGAIFSGAVTGGLLEWHPGGTVNHIAGTQLSGANGIAVSDGGKVIVVAAWGSREIVRFVRQGEQVEKTSVAVDFAPDNLRWTRYGQLLVAGQKFQASAGSPAQLNGWKVLRVAPKTLAMSTVYEVDGSAPLQGVSVAVEVGNQLWVGPFRGDRIGVTALPH